MNFLSFTGNRMKAMIFAAGLGTRLRPITDRIPKALVHAGDKTLLQWVTEKMIRSGIRDVVINIHHFPDQIRAFLERNNNFGINIQFSDESDAILDTGGALLKAAPLLSGDEPILVHNVDVLSSISFRELLEVHQASGALATLAVRKRNTSRYLLFNPGMRLTGWENRATGEIREALPEEISGSRPLAFSGIQMISPEFLTLLKGEGKFSLIDAYLQLTRDHPVLGFEDYSPFWYDLGKLENLERFTKV